MNGGLIETYFSRGLPIIKFLMQLFVVRINSIRLLISFFFEILNERELFRARNNPTRLIVQDFPTNIVKHASWWNTDGRTAGTRATSRLQFKSRTRDRSVYPVRSQFYKKNQVNRLMFVKGGHTFGHVYRLVTVLYDSRPNNLDKCNGSRKVHGG